MHSSISCSLSLPCLSFQAGNRAPAAANAAETSELFRIVKELMKYQRFVLNFFCSAAIHSLHFCKNLEHARIPKPHPHTAALGLFQSTMLNRCITAFIDTSSALKTPPCNRFQKESRRSFQVSSFWHFPGLSFYWNWIVSWDVPRTGHHNRLFRLHEYMSVTFDHPPAFSWTDLHQISVAKIVSCISYPSLRKGLCRDLCRNRWDQGCCILWIWKQYSCACSYNIILIQSSIKSVKQGNSWNITWSDTKITFFIVLQAADFIVGKSEHLLLLREDKLLGRRDARRQSRAISCMFFYGTEGYIAINRFQGTYQTAFSEAVSASMRDVPWAGIKSFCIFMLRLLISSNSSFRSFSLL